MRRVPLLGAALAACLCVIPAAGCGDAAVDGPAWQGRPVILFTVDTLRADRLGPWSDGALVTPQIDRLAARSLVFERAYSQASYTHPSLMSMFTGLLPPRHGVVEQRALAFESVVTVPELLQAAGIPTAHFTANLCRFQDVPGTLFSEGWDASFCGMADDTEHYLWDRAVVDAALEWIEARATEGGPWFAWVHLIDPHFRHRPDPEHWDYAADPLADQLAEDRLLGSWEELGEYPPAAVQAKLDALYAAEVAGVDAQLGRLLDALEGLPGGDEVSLLFSADHGEELYESWPRVGHGWSLTEGVLHVPLMVAAAGVEPGRVAAQVETLSVGPTLMQLLGVRSPYRLDGASLLSPERAVGAARSFEARLAVTLRVGDQRYWRRFSEDVWVPEMAPWRAAAPCFQQQRSLASYHGGRLPEWLPVDPGQHPEVRRFEALVDELADLMERPVDAPGEITDPAVLAQLKELGYL